MATPVASYDVSALAWEFLRRNPAYRAAVPAMRAGPVTCRTGADILNAEASDAAALAWGLHFRGASGRSGGAGAVVLEPRV